MVDERGFGYLSGELLCWEFSPVVDLRGVARCPGASRSHRQGTKQGRGVSSSTRICRKRKNTRRSTERKRTGGKEKERKRTDTIGKISTTRNTKERSTDREERTRTEIKTKKQSLGQETQKNYKHGNRKPEERGQNEAVKDIKPTDELVTRTLGQEGSGNHKCDNHRSLLPQARSTDNIGATGSKEKEWNSLGRMFNKSVEATQDNHGKVQKSSDSMVRANKKGMGRGVDSKAKTKNGKSLQVGSAEMHSRRKRGCNGVDVQQGNSNAQRSSEDINTANPVVSDSRREANGRITPGPHTLQEAEEMQPDPDISVHSVEGENDRISTKHGIKGKENQSANNCRGKMNQQFVRKKDGEVEGKAKTTAVKGKNRYSVSKKRKTEYINKEKEMEKNGTVNEHKHENLGARKNKVENLIDLDFHNEKKFTSENINKRKDLSPNSSPHGHNMKTAKLPRMSPTKNKEICRHSHQIAPYNSTELLGANACEIGHDKPQNGYNNAITGSHCSEEDIASVSSSGYRSNKGYLKQPHPDTKYLSQLYSLPPAQDFSCYIDQDWLFSQDRDERRTAAFEAAEPDHVWSDAQLIDTADVIALPYVVPL